MNQITSGNSETVSIILPVYNAEKTIAKSLESLINQSYKDLEIVCVNDGSSDNSLRILSRYSNNDKRIKVFTQKNSGPAKTRNYALKQSTGAYIMFCDADDWYEENMVELMVSAIRKHNADLAMCDCNIINVESEDIRPDSSSDYYHLKLKGFCNLTAKQLHYINVVLWNKIFRRDIIEKYNIQYPVQYEHDDLVFLYKYLLHTKRYVGIDECLYNYIVGNPDSIMGKVYSNKNEKSKFDFIFARQNLYDYLKSNNCSQDYIKYFLEEHFGSYALFYSFLNPEDKQQALTCLKHFIKSNPILLSNKKFKSVSNLNTPAEFEKYLAKINDSTFLQKIFSITNSYDKRYKIIRILGFKLSLKRKKQKEQ